jgi:hypothetical protein
MECPPPECFYLNGINRVCYIFIERVFSLPEHARYMPLCPFKILGCPTTREKFLSSLIRRAKISKWAQRLQPALSIMYWFSPNCRMGIWFWTRSCQTQCGQYGLIEKLPNNLPQVVIIGGASNATIVTADIPICGAVMHIIDAVLLPTAI